MVLVLAESDYQDALIDEFLQQQEQQFAFVQGAVELVLAEEAGESHLCDAQELADVRDWIDRQSIRACTELGELLAWLQMERARVLESAH